MALEFDSRKDARNIAQHGISLARSLELEILTVVPSDQGDERRFRAYGVIDGEVHCLVFTYRGDNIRAISLRRAHAKEINRYAPPQE